MVIKSMRDNHINRKGAGISASTLTSCPRAIAIAETYDVYEPVITGYNKGRGSWLHAMFEADPDPPPWVIREQRFSHDFEGVRITGKPDEIDTKYGVLVDYKSKDNLPKKPDPSHAFQFNVYAWLVRHGTWASDNHEHGAVAGDRADIPIKTIVAHYVTWKTKTDLAWLKMRYDVWHDDDITETIRRRLQPLIDFRQTGIIPQHAPYQDNRYWTCDCQRYEEQLAERGITL